MRLLIVNQTPQCGGRRQSANFGKLTWQTVGHQQVDNMEVCCTFRSIAGGVCGADSRARKQEIRVIPLVTCSKDISKHMSMLSFTGPEDEVDLILCRSGIFTRSEKVNTMTICPLHRAKLGLGWTRGASTRCRIPPSLSNHGKKKGKWPKGERGIGKNESEMLLRKTGIFLPVGSGKVFNRTEP